MSELQEKGRSRAHLYFKGFIIFILLGLVIFVLAVTFISQTFLNALKP